MKGLGRRVRQLAARVAYRERAIAAFAIAAAAMITAGLFLAGRGSIFLPSPPVFIISSGPITGMLSSHLSAAGLPAAETAGISAALRKKLNLRRLSPSDEYGVVLSTSGVLVNAYVLKGISRYLVRPADGGYSLEVSSLAVTEETLRVKGAIASSLWESMSASGVPAATILDFADIFSWSIDFLTEVREGDSYEVVYEQRTAENGRSAGRRILAGVYDGKGTGRKRAFRHGAGYYDEKGESLRSLFLRAPLQYRRISSYFTHARRHPILKIVRPHLGIDYAAPTGTPVSSVADGVVTFVGWKGGFGRYVEVKHALGYVTIYGHLHRYAAGLKRGRRVKQGDVIAYVGSTGLSTGPHLDFRIKANGRYVNFLTMKHRSSGGLPVKDKTAFLAEARRLLPSEFD
ncbi:MAG: metalloendopeptidase-like membrane protein [Elusimicrobia bacterium]|nr:MAG: metalloendopeptidase-like membrane protein [Elusimicrobiota bacterium]KAF0156828.1 MAG: metalloendopeptidase-like membrane protein [Elusimicrobiota bacterium]